MSASSYSIVEYCGYQTQRECGYCKGPKTNCNHGMWAHYLTVQDYQDLMDRGWRRSGRYCYKPTMDRTCCPMYTLRCHALDFRISKSQKKVLKRMAKFLRNEARPDADDDDSKAQTSDPADTNDAEMRNRGEIREEDMEKRRAEAEKYIAELATKSADARLVAEPSVRPRTSCDEDRPSVREPPKKDAIGPSRGTVRRHDGTPPKKAKLIRAERKRKKLLAQGKSPEETDLALRVARPNVLKTVDDYFDEIHGGVRKLETKLVRVMTDEFFETVDLSANLYKKYQTAIHKSEPDECDKKSFFNFLVKSPLRPSSPPDGPPQGYGSFHEQYWLDGRLIAVAVLDILPLCLSSVYFFYDPEYSFLSLGTFSSLREVCLTRRLNALAPGIRYYYMGYYIHSNPKMRYKGKMQPSELLCPETYAWCDFGRSIAKIDASKYSRLNEDPDAVDVDGFVDVRKIMVLNRINEDEETLMEYASLVGSKCAQRMLLYG